MDPEGILMHIDRANEITMAPEAALAARPVSAFGLVTMPAAGTPAAGSSFGAGRARDAGLLRFVGEVLNIAAIFPLRHTAIVASATVPVAHSVRIADEERADLMLDTEGSDLARGLVAQVAHAPLGPTADVVLRPLQLLPTARVLLAPALLSSELAELPASLPLERADTAPRDDEGLSRVGRHGSQVDLSQVNGRLGAAGSHLRLRYLEADVQLKAPVPDQRACPGVLWQDDWQYQRRVAFAHRQHDAPFLPVDGLSGPLDGVERFGVPGILRAQFWMLPAQRARCLHVGEEGMYDLLHGLSIEGEPAFGGLLQLPLPRPPGMGDARLLVCLHAEIPHSGRFHLRCFEAVEAGG